MKNLYRGLVVVSVLSLVCGSAFAEEASEAAPAPSAQIGEQAPGFSLTDETGEEHSLSDYRGKTVVLEWTNPECPFVVRHYEERTMHELIDEYAGDDLVWLSVESSHHRTAEMATSDKERFEMEPPVLLDPTGEVGQGYGARTTPHMYIIDADGVLRYNGAIDDDPRGRMESSDRTNYVKAALDQLAAGEEVETPTTTPYGCSVKYPGVE